MNPGETMSERPMIEANPLDLETNWITRPCCDCGGQTWFPENPMSRRVVAMLKADPSNMLGYKGKDPERITGAICDECADRDNARSEQRAIHNQYDPEALLAASGCPQMPEVKQLHKSLVGILASNRDSVLITGIPGTYKTSHAAEFLKRWCTVHKKPCRYTTEGDLLAELKDWNEQRHRMTALQKVQVLVVDDIGTRARTDWSAAIYHDILDARYRARKRTVLITNHPADKLSEIPAWEDRVLRRALELCGTPVVFHG